MTFWSAIDGLSNYDYSTHVNGKVVYNNKYGSLIVVSLLTFCMALFTDVLLFYHMYLICFNMTTWEQMSRENITYLKQYPSGVNPFSKGLFENLRLFFFHGHYIKEWVPLSPEDVKRNKEN